MEEQKSSTSSTPEEAISPAPELTPKEEAPKAEGIEEQVKEGAEERKAPSPRSYSTDEWNKRQSAWDKQTAAIQKQLKESSERLVEYEKTRNTLLDESQERQFADFLSKTDTAGGDMDAARLVVSAQREVAKKQREFEVQQTQFHKDQELVNEGLKTLAAQDFVKKYELGGDTLASLMEAANPMEMENKALKLKLEKASVEKKPSAKVDSGISSTKGIDFSKLSDTEKFGKILEMVEQRRT